MYLFLYYLLYWKGNIYCHKICMHTCIRYITRKYLFLKKKIFFALCTTKTIKGFQRYETNVIINLRAWYVIETEETATVVWGWTFASHARDRGSILGRDKPKSLKQVVTVVKLIVAQLHTSIRQHWFLKCYKTLTIYI